MVDTTLNYINNISAISIGVLALLSVYLISIFWVFISKLYILNSKIALEQNNLASLLARDSKINPISKLGQCIGSKSVSKELLQMCEISLVREASSGISWLSIVSSTAPFIGLFGTVVGILESFAKFSTVSKVGFSTIAPVISEALVATAAGIFVAIFAYTFHQILTRKVYELNTYLQSQIKVLVSRD
ncbi:MAG: MotA/TolQ/ExbB proton channel family protein [Campylobacterales bacterium]|nr:MotA/TolQ/ExbB proton channel family protein [Campylobacterales bacterium]